MVYNLTWFNPRLDKGDKVMILKKADQNNAKGPANWGNQIGHN